MLTPEARRYEPPTPKARPENRSGLSCCVCPTLTIRWCSDLPMWGALGLAWAAAMMWWLARELPPEG